MTEQTVSIGGRRIGGNNPCFLIAEIGMNHNGDVELAKKLILAAKEAGADAAKFQIFIAEKLVTKLAKTYGNEKGHLPPYQQEMYKKHELTESQYKELKSYCDKLGIIFFASVWDEDSADLLERVGGELFKIGSADLTYIPLLRHVAKKGRPIILSTGMATTDEIHEAVDTIKSYGNNNILLLHCVSGYPTKIEDANILVIETLKQEFDFPLGLSDHTETILSSILAVALGAKVIEKHFTIDKKLPGVDHHLSLDPEQFKDLVVNVRLAEKALGTKEKRVLAAEKETRGLARRSIVACENIPQGTVISDGMVTCKRPGGGIQPKYIDSIIGKRAKRDIKEDEVISWDGLT